MDDLLRSTKHYRLKNREKNRAILLGKRCSWLLYVIGSDRQARYRTLGMMIAGRCANIMAIGGKDGMTKSVVPDTVALINP